MIRINDMGYEWQEGLTVSSLLNILKKDNRFSYLVQPAVTVAINDKIIPRAEFDRTAVNDGDHVKLRFIISGG